MKKVLTFMGRLALVFGIWVGVRAAANPLNFCGRELVQNLVGGQTALLASASPVTYANPQAPPFLIMHGDDDSFVPFSQARRLQQALQAVHAPVELAAVHHANHGFRGHPNHPKRPWPRYWSNSSSTI